jgi:uncharacterized SAM-binding protein YcdF (DUF218 family)
MDRQGRPSAALKRRTALAVELWQKGLSPVVVISGGSRPGRQRTEAEAAAEYALALGLSSEALVIESRARSTEENARFSAELLGQIPVVVVTENYHRARAGRVFRRYFKEVDTVGAETPLPEKLFACFRELICIGYYGMRGRF